VTRINAGLQSDWKLCVAPMMEWTDRHCRHFHRLLAPHARLYTEMVSTGALLHGPRERLLTHSAEQHPVALQLGGADPASLAACATFAADAGFDEVNLNVGCPSDRVQQARIGACLMLEPGLVAECVSAMRAAVGIPITVKCRTGVDAHDDYDFLARFVDTVAGAGCTTFIVHARKAILTGLSPAQNRTIPPLDWTRVSRLKADFPELTLVVNGGIETQDVVHAQLQCVDGVMLGRAAYHNPWILTTLNAELFGTTPPIRRGEALDRLLPYVRSELDRGSRLHDVARHLHGLFNGLPGARRYRRHLSEHSHRAGAGIDVLIEAASFVNEIGIEELPSACSNA
jgi:tRNA-dihydrouridine synthase A